MTAIKGQVYVVKMCDTIQNAYYKVGRSIDFFERKKCYNYSEVLNVMKSDDIVYDETEIIKIFNKNCKLNKGKEFFTAESDDFVLNIFLDYFQNKLKKNIKSKAIIEPAIEPFVKLETIIESKSTIEPLIESIIQSIEPDIESIIEPVTEPVVEHIIKNIVKTYKHTCTKCNNNFKYASYLQRHMNSKKECKILKLNKNNDMKNNDMKNSNLLNLYILDTFKQYLDTKTQKIITSEDNKIFNKEIKKIYNCNNCNSNFTSRQALHRHKKLKRCKNLK
jgi:hypothetical protein